MTWIPKRARQPKGWLLSWLVFTGLCLVFGGLNLWLVSRGYSSDFDQLRWSKVLTSLDDKEFRIEHLSLLYPHGPIYLLAVLRATFGLDSLAVSAWLSALIMVLMFFLWNRHLRQKGYPFLVRAALLALLALHPFTLWAASSGLNNALSLLLFYLFCYACYLVVSIYDLRAMIMAAGLLAALFFADERTIFVFLALLPLVPLLAPARMVEDSLPSVYAILAFPLATAVAGWVYLNWVFHNDPWAFLQASEGSFRGALLGAQSNDWLALYGGQWLAPGAFAALSAVIAFPLPLWLAWRHRRYYKQVGAGLALFFHPAIAAGLASMVFFLEDLPALLYLLVAITMGMILLMPRTRRVMPMLAALALGNLGGWLVMDWHPSPHTQTWLQALAGKKIQNEQDSLVQLGLWLKEHPQPTLLDDRLLYRSIVARGNARGLVLPFMYRFKNEMRRDQPTTEQVVVLNPSVPAAGHDRVTQQFPAFFWYGAPGYVLAYDDGEWRVWQRRPTAASAQDATRG